MTAKAIVFLVMGVVLVVLGVALLAFKRRRSIKVGGALVATSAVAFLILGVQSIEAPDIQVIWYTLLAGGVLALAGIGLLFSGKPALQDLGSTLMTGSAVTLAVFGLQLYSDQNSREIEARREAGARQIEARREAQARQIAAKSDFRLAIAVAPDLSGFEPEMKNWLQGLYLGRKVLDGVNFDDQNLEDVVFQDASLQAAHLHDAILRGANALNADFFEADLRGADLTGADLRFAKFEAAFVEFAKSFRGAKVNSETCWPAGFLQTDLAAQLKPMRTSYPDDRPDESPSKGHVCDSNEHEKAGP
jgi:hypothetical protein